MLLDIVILPPADLRRKIGRKIREATKGLKTVFVVDNQKFIPHLSLFHIRIPRNRIKKLELRIREVLKKYKPFVLTGLTYYSGGDPGHFWVGQEISHPRILTYLHEEIVRECHQLRIGMMPATSKKYNRLEKFYRKKYGSRHLLKFFHPHFTLGMVKTEADLTKMVGRMHPLKFTFPADNIAITEVNFWHQVTRLIKEFKIKK